MSAINFWNISNEFNNGIKPRNLDVSSFYRIDQFLKSSYLTAPLSMVALVADTTYMYLQRAVEGQTPYVDWQNEL